MLEYRRDCPGVRKDSGSFAASAKALPAMAARRLIGTRARRRVLATAFVVTLVCSPTSLSPGHIAKRALVVGTSVGLYGRSTSKTARASSYEVKFQYDISEFTSETREHAADLGGPPAVESFCSGEGAAIGCPDGLFAAGGTLKIAVPAKEVFDWMTDPVENARIFASNVAGLNYRKFLGAGAGPGTRCYEVSKVGKWRLLGIPLSFESTVIAVEDWEKLEVRYMLKKPGAMRVMAGFWRAVQLNSRETLVLFYTEGVPNFPMPGILRRFAGKVCQDMASSLLGDLRAEAVVYESNNLLEKEKEEDLVEPLES